MQTWPLLERDGVLEQIAEACRSARYGNGVVALVEGDAGVGKTSILHAAAERTAAEGFRILTARGRELEQSLRYGIARQLLLPLLVDPEIRVDLTGAIGTARDVLTDDPHARADAFAVSHGLYWLLANASAHQPVVLVVDDAHWADPLSLRWLAYSAARLDGLCVAGLVATRRTRDRPPELNGLAELDSCVHVAVKPLTPRSTAALVKAARPDADDAFVEACHGLTGGNPFLLHELVAEVIAEGIDRGVPGAARLSGLHHESVAAHVLQRLQPLGAHAITLAEALVVVGDGGSLRHAAALAELPTDDAELVADAIEQARVLMSRQPVRFVHPLVADAIGAQIPAGRRSVWHRRVARLLVEEGDTERAVSHLLEVTPAGETWVIDLLRAEARRALTTGDGRSAAAMLARALREPPPAADRGRLLADLGEAELAAGLPSCVAHLREARQLAADPVGIERSARLLATALGVHGPVKLAGVVLEEALEALGQDDARSARLRAELLTIAQASHPLAAQTKDQLEEAARAADGSSPADAMLLAALGYQQSLTWRVPAVSALENLAEAFDSDLIELAGCDSNAVVMGGTGLILTGAWDLADHVFGQIADQARSLGSSRGLAHSLVLRARLALARGAFDDAEVDAQVAAGITAAAYPMLLPFALAEIVLALSARGEAEAAATMLADQQLADGDLPPTTPGTFLIVARMSLRRRLGDIDAAAADLARLDEFVVDRGTYPRGWASEIVATLSACGRTEEALVVAGEHLDAAHRWGLPADIAEAMRSRAALCPTEALDLLRAAAEFVEHADVAWLRAPIYADLGAALRRANQRAQARPYLEEALDIAHRCGAIPLERHVRAELLASGARPRRLARTGVAALTPSERRIAQMATQGLSNSEIAQALFITRKTVEKHLGNCFVKLGISQRGDLGPLLAAVEDLSTPG